MAQIYTYLNVPDITANFGTKSFEQKIVELETKGEYPIRSFVIQVVLDL